MTPVSPQAPSPQTPATDQAGLLQRDWWLYFIAISRRLDVLKEAVLGWTGLQKRGRMVQISEEGTLEQSDFRAVDVVLGATSLTTTGAIPAVTATDGTLAESAVTDDGSGLILILARSVQIDNNKAYTTKDSAGSNRNLLVLDNANPDILHVRNNQRAAGGTIQLETISGGGIGLSIDNAGNVNTPSGVYQVAGTQVVGARGAALTGTGAALAFPSPGLYSQAYTNLTTQLANNLKTRVDEIEARLQAHGLIT